MSSFKQIQFLKQILTAKEFVVLKRQPEAFKQAIALYDETYIDTVVVAPFNTKRFVLNKKEASNLLPQWEDTLREVSLQKELVNPVYVQVKSNGTMLIE